MDLNEFVNEVLDRFSQEITDQVFLMVQDDRELMQKYLAAVSDKGKDTVNRSMGKAIKTRFALENLPMREAAPVSTLIKSHQEF